MDQNQTTRFSKGEMELIKNTFSGDGEQILYQIRNVFMQFGGEVPKLHKDVLSVLKKMMLPELEADVPLGQQADNYISLSNINQIPPDVAYLHIKAKDIVVNYLRQQYEELVSGKLGTIILEDLKKPDGKTDEERFTSMMAFTFLVNAYIDSCLLNLKTLANQVEKTEEQLKEEAKVNSTK